MLTVQVGNETENKWMDLACYKTMNGANNFIAKERKYYPDDAFSFRIIGDEEKKSSNYRDYSKEIHIGDVFTGCWGYEATFYEAYVVVGLTPSGKSIRVKKLQKVNDGWVESYGPCSWQVRFIKPSEQYLNDPEDVKTVRVSEYDYGYGSNAETRLRFKLNSFLSLHLNKGFDYDSTFIEDDYH